MSFWLALLLSGFAENLFGPIIGVNLGGLGTLTASMASLISQIPLLVDGLGSRH